MAQEGRIYGRKTADGKAYELVQGGIVRQTIPIDEVHASERMKRAIHLNRWEPL